jgi:catalase
MDDGSQGLPAGHPIHRREEAVGAPPASTDKFMAQFEVNDKDTYMTTNTGGPIEDQESLSAGERGPTLLEDFIFREKITHFGMQILVQN